MEPQNIFGKTYQATHPSMIDGISNEALCNLYQVTDLFVADEISLNYTHNERMVIGGAAPVKSDVRLPDQTEPVEGAPFLERRELGAINVGTGSGKATIDASACAFRYRQYFHQGRRAGQTGFAGGVKRPHHIQVCCSGDLQVGVAPVGSDYSRPGKCVEHNAATSA